MWHFLGYTFIFLHRVVPLFVCEYLNLWASLVAQRLKRLPAMQETWVRSLGREDPLEKETATHSSILAWRIPWMEESGGLQSTGSQRVGHDWATSHTHTHHNCDCFFVFLMLFNYSIYLVHFYLPHCKRFFYFTNLSRNTLDLLVSILFGWVVVFFPNQ